MDQSDIKTILVDELQSLNWASGLPKADLVESLQGYEPLARMLGNYLADVDYRDIDAVLNQIPEQAWQDAQGSEWHGASPITEPVAKSGYMRGPGGLQETADGVAISSASSHHRMHPPHSLTAHHRGETTATTDHPRHLMRYAAIVVALAASAGSLKLIRGRRRQQRRWRNRLPFVR